MKSTADKNLITLEDAKSDLVLNALWINVSPAKFQAHILDLRPDEISTLRNKYGDSWYFRPRGGRIIALPLTDGDTLDEQSKIETLDVNDCLGIVSRLVQNKLPEKFDSDSIVSTRRGLELKHGANIADRVASESGIIELVGKADIRPHFKIDTRLINPARKTPFVAIVVGIRTPHSITAPLKELKKSGVELSGMVVRKRNPEPDESRLVGTIDRIDNGTVHLRDQHGDNPSEMPASDLQLEGRPEVVEYALSSLVGRKDYRRFRNQLEDELNEFRQGDKLVKYLGLIKKNLTTPKSTIDISRSLLAEVKGWVSFRNTSSQKSRFQAARLEYYYNPSRSHSDKFVFPGLERYGPYSQASFPKQSPTLLVVTPDEIQGTTEDFVSKFAHGIKDSNYELGFDSAYRLKDTDFRFLTIHQGATYNSSPGRAYKQELEHHFSELGVPPNQAYDAAIVALEDRFERYEGEDSPYLQSKSFLLSNGISIQHVLASTMQDRGLQYSLQNVSTALYAKMGGVPWTVSQDESVVDELVIGLGIAELHDGRFGARERFMGITTVFEGNGNYLLSNFSQTCKFEDYPDELRRVTLQLLRDQKEERAWKPGNLIRLTFHTSFPVRKIDVNRIVKECVDEVGKEQEIQFAFLTIDKRHPYVLLDRRNGDDNPPFVPDRGTVARISGRQVLISPLGNYSLIRGEAMRRPLKLKLHDNSTFRDLYFLAEQVYKFTGISWKTVRPVKMPVTIEYSSLIARQLQRLSQLPNFSASMLNTSLSSSKWFL